jgi:hypothetical protein
MERNGADYAMIARTISERTGYLYTANQMRYLSKKEASSGGSLSAACNEKQAGEEYESRV